MIAFYSKQIVEIVKHRKYKLFTMKPFSSTGPLFTLREAGDLMLMVQHSSMLRVDTEDWMFSPGCLGVSL